MMQLMTSATENLTQVMVSVLDSKPAYFYLSTSLLIPLTPAAPGVIVKSPHECCQWWQVWAKGPPVTSACLCSLADPLTARWGVTEDHLCVSAPYLSVAREVTAAPPQS